LPALTSTPVPVDDLPPGPVESALATELSALVGEPPWKGTLSALATLNARLLDQARALDRLDLASPLQLRLLEVLDRLRAIAPPPSGPARNVGDEAAAFLSGLNTPDDDDQD